MEKKCTKCSRRKWTIDGYQCGKSIKKYLEKLKIFEMTMRFSPSNNENKEEQLKPPPGSKKKIFGKNINLKIYT